MNKYPPEWDYYIWLYDLVTRMSRIDEFEIWYKAANFTVWVGNLPHVEFWKCLHKLEALAGFTHVTAVFCRMLTGGGEDLV
jgi:hypothetical protein